MTMLYFSPVHLLMQNKEHRAGRWSAIASWHMGLGTDPCRAQRRGKFIKLVAAYSGE